MLSELTKQIKNLTADAINNIHTAIPGRIVKFYPEKCEADILPFGQFKTPDGKVIEYPQISGVPVMFPQSANQSAAIIFPIRKDDECLLIIAEQTLDIWRKNTTQDNIDFKFELTNAVAIPGLFSKPIPLVKTAYDNDTLIIAKDNAQITMRNDRIIMTGNMEFDDLTVNGDLTVKGNAEIAENLIVTGNTNIGGELSVDGDTSIDGELNARKDLYVFGDINASENLDVMKNLNVYGHADISGDISIAGDLSVSGNLIAESDAVFQNNVDITGILTLAGVNMNSHIHSVAEDNDTTGEPQ